MKHNSILLLLCVASLMIVISSCNQMTDQPSPTEMVAAANETTEAPVNTDIPTEVPTTTLIPTEKPTAALVPTDTLVPTEESTAISLPDSMLGTEVIPLEELSSGMPWLEMGAEPPRNKYLLFNFRQPVISDPLVRQALSYAVDREAIAALVSQDVVVPHRPATVITPPEILGRDLYGAVGIQYDPQKAKDLLIEAGYQDPADFPEITFMVTPVGSSGPDGNLNIVNAVTQMWSETLGISVRIKVIDTVEEFFPQIVTDSYDVVLLSWYADYNDPNNFLREPFHTDEPNNFGLYSNEEFDRLVLQAADIQEPADRQALYILAEDVLCQQDPAVIPLFFYGNPFSEQ